MVKLENSKLERLVICMSVVELKMMIALLEEDVPYEREGLPNVVVLHKLLTKPNQLVIVARLKLMQYIVFRNHKKNVYISNFYVFLALQLFKTLLCSKN